MRIYQKLTPLTEDEQRFAEDNHSVIAWCLKLLNYDYEENYSVAVFGYLKAVKKWFATPELHRYDFKTIAKWMIRGYLGNEEQKSFRRIQTISLDAPVGEDNEFTLIDTITYDNYLNCYVS